MWRSYLRRGRELVGYPDDDNDSRFYLPLEGEIERDFGLADQFEDDAWDTFLEQSEFAVIMTFEIRVDHKPHKFRTKVVWDTETLKNRLVVQQQGVYMGSVLCFILKRLFPIEPKPDEIIWEIVNRGDPRRHPHGPRREIKQGWRVLDIVDAEYMYELSLDKLVAS